MTKYALKRAESPNTRTYNKTKGVIWVMTISCEKCDLRDSCTTLCPEAEAFVSQDHVPMREMTFTDLGIEGPDILTNENGTIAEYENDSNTKLTRKQQRICILHDACFSNTEIADIVGCSRRYVRLVVEKLKNGTICSV